MRLVAKKMQVKEGPKSNCPMAAFCSVENKEVPAIDTHTHTSWRKTIMRFGKNATYNVSATQAATVPVHVLHFIATYQEKTERYFHTNNERPVQNTRIPPEKPQGCVSFPIVWPCRVVHFVQFFERGHPMPQR